jgi:hypothetical protein
MTAAWLALRLRRGGMSFAGTDLPTARRQADHAVD